MGVNDYGAAASPLDAPPLGGPGGWAESVSAVLDGSDETVDSRIAVATADLGARISRPNVDDRLVEMWNGSAWSVVDYDSGWRDISSLLINGWTITSVGGGDGKVWVRRKDQGVTMVLLLNGAASTGSNVLNTPTGFRANARQVVPAADAAAPIVAEARYGSGYPIYVLGTANPTRINAMYSTNDPIPTTLPGTLVTAAPQ